MIEFFNQGGKNSVTVISSDFNHIKKQKRTSRRNGYLYIDTKIYTRNISVKRILSHIDFSKKAIIEAKKCNPDILYVMLPPNTLGRYAAKYKRKHPEVKLIFDIIDLWPESLPINIKIKKLLTLPLNIWRNFRDKSLKYADKIITECNLYKQELKIDSQTLYLAKDNTTQTTINFFEDKINVCYLGSINNIIDIGLIKKLLNQINKKKQVILHIIGDGESREQFISEVESCGIKTIFYGKVFDDKKKSEIFSKCNFAINIMKRNTKVGLSIKSIDYFEAGLPILNNIKEDTYGLIEKYCAGFNISDDNIEEVAHKIVNLSKEEFLNMSTNTKKVFENYFNKHACEERLQKILVEEW